MIIYFNFIKLLAISGTKTNYMRYIKSLKREYHLAHRKEKENGRDLAWLRLLKEKTKKKRKSKETILLKKKQTNEQRTWYQRKKLVYQSELPSFFPVSLLQKFMRFIFVP